MTHGIIEGRRNRLGGEQETLREWADYVALYFGRGVLLKELYITPELLGEERWHALGTTARWATDNWRVLERTRMFGGDPRRGEPYGYAHWLGERGILALRNPSYRAMTMRLPIDEATGYLGEHEGAFAVRQVYPAHLRLPIALAAGTRNELTLPPCSVWLLELRPEAAWSSAPIPPEPPRAAAMVRDTARLAQTGEGTGTVTCDLSPLAGPHARLEAYALVRGDGERYEVTATMGESPLRVRRSSGGGWVLCAFDLAPHAQQSGRLTVQLRAAEASAPFEPRATLELWLIGDAGTIRAGDPFEGEHLPWACAQGLSRYSVRLLPLQHLPMTGAETVASLTDAQLERIHAAWLRLELFDVNAEESYAGKQILLNGIPVGEVPPNRGELSAWQEHVIEIPADALPAIARTNTVVLTNAGGDCYKFRALALAVETADGLRAVTASDPGVYSSVTAWQYAEGDVFEGDRSPPIVLTLP
ncbi:MAG: hypothetical protein AB7Y46_09540 [Armatimonadota bacterium]